MNQIELFGEEINQQELDTYPTDDKTYVDQVRPEKVVIESENIHSSPRWRQCKIIGKNVSIRSYSASCAFQNKFYIYGGYQILKGTMDDFYWIDLDDQVDRFDWIPIQAKGHSPGPRSKHALVGGKQKIYLVAGLCTDVKSSNEIFQFNPSANTWKLLKPAGEALPCIDSFGCVYIQTEEEEKIIIIGGYNGDRAEYINSVYQYNITKNEISILFDGFQKNGQDIPKPRSGCSATTDGKSVFIFGGKDAEDRMNDLWEFSLLNLKFKKLQGGEDIPSERNGHTLNYYNKKLYLFGGIHDITWQLDDLLIYNFNKNKWITLEHDSPRKTERKIMSMNFGSTQKNANKNLKKKNWHSTHNQFPANKSDLDHLHTRPFMTYRDNEHHSPGKMIDEQRKKAFLQKKSQMLKNFEITKEEKRRYVVFQTSSQAMKNSLDVIGDPDPTRKRPQGRLTEFGKHTTSKFLEPLSNNTNLIPGKKPCARDGHCSAILNGELIIFGGDRHQMSFNDIYKLNMSMTSEEAD